MTQFNGILATLRRPQLLIAAAQHFARQSPKKKGNFGTLIEQENALNDARRTGLAGYSPARHIEILGRLMALSRRSVI